MKQKEQKSGRSRFRFIDFFIVALCLSVMFYSVKLFRDDLFQTIEMQNVQPVGSITIRNHIVQRRIVSRILWDRLRVESPVYLGDTIRVAELSAATLNIEEHQIDIEENTLIRILLSPDGSGKLQILLNEGSLTLSNRNASADAQGFQLNLMGRIIETKAGTTLGASTTEDGIKLQVTEGTALFIEDGESREISSGEMIVLDSEGAELSAPSAVVTQPRPNARYVKSTTQPLPVRFAWNRVNLSPQDTLRLEIASDRNFSRIVQSVRSSASSAEVSLEAGVWNWRLLYENTNFPTESLSGGKFTIVEASNISLLSPARGSLFRYRDDALSLRFQWSQKEEASHYVIEIAPTPDFANPRINREISASFFVDSSLTEGTWYWRVQPVFSHIYEGGASFSPASFFVVERTEQNIDEGQMTALLEGEQLRELERSVEGNEQIPEPATALAVTQPPVLAEAPPRPVQRTTPQTQPASQPRQASRPQSTPQQTPSAAPSTASETAQLLPPSGNRQPTNGQVIGIEQLKTRRNIVFTWAAVEGANAYIFTLYEQGAERRQIAGVITTDPTWTLENIDILGRGTFVWQIEAVSRNADGVIARHGVLGENTFTMDIPQPRPVQMEAPGVLYGF